MSDKYHHLVQIDVAQRKLQIDRVHADGKITLFTIIDIPSSTDKNAFTKFAAQFGENLLMDSPQARKLFNL